MARPPSSPLFVVLALAAIPACSGDESPSDTRTSEGGAAGSGGSPASAGSAGSPASTVAGSAGTGTGGGTATPNQSCTSPTPALSREEQMLVELPADSWHAAPDTRIRPVCPAGGGDCANVIEPWSGGTFDPVHNQMLIFGGGHADYAGNEVYAFDVATLTWSRLTDPSPDTYLNEDPLPDGQPVSRHSYDGISYVAHADRMFAHGGSRWQDGSGTNVSWAFDPVARSWTDRQPADALPLANCCSEGSAYDPSTGRVFFHLTNSLAAYDWDENRWVVLQDYGSPPYWPRYEAWGDKRGLVDTHRNLLWFFGSGLVLVYDIAQGQHVTDDWIATGGATFTNAADVGDRPEQVITTGGGEVITAQAPGVDYDTAADDLVAWVGGGPWILDLETRVWTHSSASGGPAAPAAHGTYGRWRYIPRLNVFILVNGVDQDVYFYKHTAGCGS